MQLYFVYMLLCADDSYYIGVTNDVDVRFWQHQSGMNEECYTYTRRPVKLVYCAEFYEIADAIAWEKRIKGWSRAKKKALADNDWRQVHDVVRAERKRRERPSTTALRASAQDDTRD